MILTGVQHSNPIMSVNSIPQDGHVRHILISNDNLSFYLEIPLDIINSLCLKPCKYLVFLGWCILGVQGRLSLNNGHGVTMQGYTIMLHIGGKFSSKLLLSYPQDTDDVLSV